MTNTNDNKLTALQLIWGLVFWGFFLTAMYFGFSSLIESFSAAFGVIAVLFGGFIATIIALSPLIVICLIIGFIIKAVIK